MIRVLIERHLKKDNEPEYHKAIRKLKQKASHRDGYLSGEMLIDPEDSSHCLILSNWQDLESWKVWNKSTERKTARDTIRKMLTKDENILIFQSTSMK